MKLLCFDIITTLIYAVSMVYLLRELRVSAPEARRAKQTVPMMLAATLLYVVAILKTHALAAMF